MLLHTPGLKQFVAIFAGTFETELVPGFVQGHDFLGRVDRLGTTRADARHAGGGGDVNNNNNNAEGGVSGLAIGRRLSSFLSLLSSSSSSSSSSTSSSPGKNIADRIGRKTIFGVFWKGRRKLLICVTSRRKVELLSVRDGERERERE